MTKICSVCKMGKDISAFYENKKRKYILPYCKKCENKKSYERLKSNPEKLAKKTAYCKMLRKMKSQEMSEKIDYLKLERGCLICGNKSFASSLSFHHLNPEEKTGVVSEMIGKGCLNNREDIMKEIEKCIILCCNCHIALHAGLIQLPEQK